MRTKKAFDRTTGAEIKLGDSCKLNDTRGTLIAIISETAVEVQADGRFSHAMVHPSEINACIEITEGRS